MALIKNTQEEENNELFDLIAPAGFKVESKDIQIGERYARTLFVATYPKTLNTGWLTPIITMAEETNISLFVLPSETQTVLKNLTKKSARLQAQIQIEEGKGKVRDPVTEAALENIEKLRDQLQEGSQKLFKFGVYITFFGETPQHLDKIENDIKSVLDTKMISSKPAVFQQEQGFNSTLPLGKDELGIYSTLNTGPISSCFPFISSNLSDNKGVLYGINRHNNSLILFDRFSLENANMVVFAKSGSGKSYTVKLEILRSLMQDTDVIIIDPEKEYKYLTDTVDGTFVDISLTSPNHINPFDLPTPGPDDKPADLLKSNILNLVGLIKIMVGGLSPKEDSILDKALIETYASRDITPDSDFSSITPPRMEDLYTILKGMDGGEELAQKLEKYVSGTYSDFFNQPTNVKLNRRLVTFSIRDMEEELRPIAMYIILNYIWNIIRSDIKKRMMVIDEAWWMMKHQESASFLHGLAKRCRKYYLGLTTITQDVADFLKSKYGKPILTNSSLQLLLRQSPAAIDIIKKTFNLTDQEKRMLLESSIGEGMFFAGTKHVAIKVVASYTEDQIITTDPAQLLKIEKAKQELEAEEGPDSLIDL